MELHHVVSHEAWVTACSAGVYAPEALNRDGFLHCCTPAQLDFVLLRHFSGVAGLLVLTFNTDDVQAAVRWVKSEPDQDAFPHLYGPIPVDAVCRVEPQGLAAPAR